MRGAMVSGFPILVHIGIMFLTSLIFGFSALKIYDLFLRALREKSRLKLWWAFSLSIFLISLIIFLSNFDCALP